MPDSCNRAFACKHYAWVGLLCFLLVMTAQAGEGDGAAGKLKAAACAACHGVDGNRGADPTLPKLAGQVPEYLVKQLKDFKSGRRQSAIMKGFVKSLRQQDMQDIAAYYASQKIKISGAHNAELAKQGERIYRGGNAKTGVSACMSCHGPSGHGIPPRFPRVSGQNAAYSAMQLFAFKSGQRHNDDEIMIRTAFPMSAQEIQAVAEYMSGLY